MSVLASRLQSYLFNYLATRKSIWSRYGLPLFTTILTCYVVFVIRQTENVQISSIILAATVFAAVHGGLGSALLSTLIGTVFVELWLLESQTAWPSTYAGYLRVIIHILVSVGVSLLVSLLRQSFYTSEELRNRAEAINREKDSILSIVAHDLRNPIGSAIGFADVMLDPSITDLSQQQRQKFIGNIQRACRLSLDIIDDLQEFASLGHYHPIIENHRIDLVAELSSIVASMEIRAKNKKIGIRTDFPAVKVFVTSDIKLLNRAVQNIVDNAIKYSPVGSLVYICCRPNLEQDRVQIEVQDHGNGIPLNEQDKIFEPFYKCSNQPTAGEKSTGLGLYSLKSIAEILDIKVSLRSQVGSGSTFILSFPMERSCERHPVLISGAPLNKVRFGSV